MAEKTQESTKKIRDDFLYPLLNCGLVDCVRSVIDGREKIWFPVDNEDRTFSLFQNQNDKRLTVNDLSIYPYPFRLELELEDSTRRRKIYDAEIAIENKKNISEIYRLEDANKTEISVKQLVDKYLSNPKSCFIADFERYRAPLNNTFYSKQITLELQKKYFFNSQSPRHKFTEFSKNQIEDCFTNDASVCGKFGGIPQ